MFDLAVLGDLTVLRWRSQRVNLRPMERVLILALMCAKGHLLTIERQVAVGFGEFRQDLYDEAAATLEAALGLWRGAPLADAADLPFASAEITRLENLYRAATITVVEARIAVGRHWEVVGELAGMAVARPDDGKVWHLLITSLYRSDRDAEAGTACQDGIRIFRE